MPAADKHSWSRIPTSCLRLAAAARLLPAALRDLLHNVIVDVSISDNLTASAVGIAQNDLDRLLRVHTSLPEKSLTVIVLRAIYVLLSGSKENRSSHVGCLPLKARRRALPFRAYG